jgi:hypothetical protein
MTTDCARKTWVFLNLKMGLAAHARRSRLRQCDAVQTNDPLLEEISALLAAAEAGDDPARLERTLTDGYARALSLEAERRRLQKQIGALTGGDAESLSRLAELIEEMKSQEGDLGLLRAQLGHLRRRHSLAVRGR